MNSTSEFCRHAIALAIEIAFQPPKCTIDEVHGWYEPAKPTVPELRLVYKAAIGLNLKLAEKISQKDRALLLAWYVAKKPTAEQNRAVLAIARKAIQLKCWIACNCCSVGGIFPDYPPIIVVMNLHDDNYTLRNQNGRPDHAPNCPFRFDSTKKSKAHDREAVRTPKGEPDLLKGRPIGSGRVHQPCESNRESATATLPAANDTLHRYFRHLMSKAALNQITPNRTYMGEMEAVSNAATKMKHREREDLTLDRCMLINPPNVADSDLMYWLFETSKDMWPEDELPVGYVLLVCDTIEKRDDGRSTLLSHIKLEHNLAGGQLARPKIVRTEFTPECQIPATEIQGIPVNGPYLVMLRAEKDIAGKPVWIGGVAHPIISRDCWLPVRSDPERDAYNPLYRIAEELERAGIEYAIHVVLEFLYNDKGDSCKPDFSVQLLNALHHVRQLFIETQKTSSEEYFQGKVGPHEIMRDIGELYIDDRFKYSRAVADKRLLARLREYFGLPASKD